MNLSKKKELAKRTLNAGKKKIVFVKARLGDIKEAITKQDIRDLHKEGAILIKENKGKRKVEKRKRPRKTGKIKKIVSTRKSDYIILTRKLRKYVAHFKANGTLSASQAKDIRNKIRNKAFKSKAQLGDYIKELNKS